MEGCGLGKGTECAKALESKEQCVQGTVRRLCGGGNSQGGVTGEASDTGSAARGPSAVAAFVSTPSEFERYRRLAAEGNTV